MKRLNWLFTLTSLDVVLVSIERFSFTGKILLQPYSFLRLHELVQMSVLILISALLPFFILKEVSHNFETVKTKKGMILATLFITGLYFYATGNGLHELASFQFNTFCNTRVNYWGQLCGSMFFNDYYTGNILYFIGAYLMNLSLILIEMMKPRLTITKKDYAPIIINSVIYGLAIFAYSGFDRVLVGLIFSIFLMVTIDLLLLKNKKIWKRLPFTTYSALTYTIGTVASILVRLFR